MTPEVEHREAVAEARARVEAAGGRPLRPLPAGFAESRLALHTVAERLIKPKRVLETGNEIALRYTAGGFGTPPWERGAASGRRGQARVEGAELVLAENGDERRALVGDLRAGAELLGTDPTELAGAEGVEVDATAAAALADWFAYGTVVLAELLARHPDLDPAPIRLWPEHFDVATELGPESEGRRANYGASPGDEDHAEPYVYVGPWQAPEAESELWNATAFPGAELGYAELLDSEGQVEAGVAFMERRLEALR